MPASDRALRPVFAELAAVLDAIAAALESHDRAAAEATLARSRATDGLAAQMHDAIELAEETARVAPAWWRARELIGTYAGLATHADRAVRNARVLARATVRAIDVGRPVAADLPAAIRLLADGARRAGAGAPEHGARNDAASLVLTAVELAERARRDDRSLATAALVSQVRSLASDLLQGLGVEQDAASRRVRRAGALGAGAHVAEGP